MHMRPVIYQGDFYLIDGDQGTDLIPGDLVSLSIPVGESASFEDAPASEYPDLAEVSQYVESDEIYSIEHRRGFYGRYSAPGYLDATDWTWGDSADEVQADLERMYGEDVQ